MFKVIHTERLVLRQLRPEDRDDFFAYRAHPEVTKFQSWHPKSVDEIEIFIEQMRNSSPNIPGTWYQIAICETVKGQIIGDIGLHFPENDPLQVEIGYSIAPLFQRKGYAFESVKAILTYIFCNMEKHRVYASIDPQNKGSLALLEKLGFRREAYFQKSLLINGVWCDDVVYAILEEGWLRKEPDDPAN